MLVFKCYVYKNFLFVFGRFALLKEGLEIFNFLRQKLLIYHQFFWDIFSSDPFTFFILSNKCYQSLKALLFWQLSIIYEVQYLITCKFSIPLTYFLFCYHLNRQRKIFPWWDQMKPKFLMSAINFNSKTDKVQILNFFSRFKLMQLQNNRLSYHLTTITPTI